MRILRLVIITSPIGVFALMAVTAGKYGVQVIGPLDASTNMDGTAIVGHMEKNRSNGKADVRAG
jgi:Na+/H+-dicarboxylate symporter